jgi:hypothetical protein
MPHGFGHHASSAAAPNPASDLALQAPGAMTVLQRLTMVTLLCFHFLNFISVI